MICVRCNLHKTSEKRLNLEKYNIHGDICRINCDICFGFLAVKMDDKIIDINSTCSDKLLNTWREIQNNREKLMYYVLSQVIYLECDVPIIENMESPFDFADESDIILLRWFHGKPIGFYTIKPKDTEIAITGERYPMPVVDTAYIRSEYRNRGFGSEILIDVTTRYPNEDVGFSKPISMGMLKVLKKFLIKNKKYRLRFWEIADCDVNGSQKLLWYRLRQ